jgi:hypothetical protein
MSFCPLEQGSLMFQTFSGCVKAQPGDMRLRIHVVHSNQHIVEALEGVQTKAGTLEIGL